MASIEELIRQANLVKAEEEKGGNTKYRIGDLYLGIIDFLYMLDRRTIDPSGYDDTALREAIARLDDIISQLDTDLENAINLVNQEKDRLDNVVDNLDRDIEEKVDKMLDEGKELEDHAEDIRNIVNEGDVYWKSGWDANIEAYLQEVGVWARNGDVIKTQWTTLKQSVSEILARVSSVETDLNGRPTKTEWSELKMQADRIEQSVNALIYDGEVTEALRTSIEQYIHDGIAELNLGTTYAKIEDMNGAKQILEWMYSGMHSSASADKTFTEIVAAGKSGMNSAISDLRTYVEKLENGEYVASSSLTSKVNDAITGLYNTASKDDAMTTIFSQVKKDTDDIASIVTHATNDYSSISVAAKFDKWRGGLFLKSDMDGVRAALLAAMDEKIRNATAGLVLDVTMEEAIAELTARFENKMAGFLLKTDLEGAVATMIAQDTGSGTVAKIFVKANSMGSSIGLNADHVTVNSKKLSVWASEIESQLGGANADIESFRNTMYGYTDQSQTYHDGIIDRLGDAEDVIEAYEDDFAWIKATKSDIVATINRFDKSTGKLLSTAGLVTTANYASLIASYMNDNGVMTQADMGVYLKTDQFGNKLAEARINADQIKFDTVDWTVTNKNTGDTIFHLDNNGNLEISGSFKGKLEDVLEIGKGTRKMYLEPTVTGARLIGVDGSQTVLTLGFYYDNTYGYIPRLNLRTPAPTGYNQDSIFWAMTGYDFVQVVLEAAGTTGAYHTLELKAYPREGYSSIHSNKWPKKSDTTIYNKISNGSLYVDGDVVKVKGYS